MAMGWFGSSFLPPKPLVSRVIISFMWPAQPLASAMLGLFAPTVIGTPLHHLAMFFAAEAFQSSLPSGTPAATLAARDDWTHPVLPAYSTLTRPLDLSLVRVPSV